jgi:hypothetical protein
MKLAMQKSDIENIEKKYDRIKRDMFIFTLVAIGSIITIFIYLRLLSS